MVFELDEHYDRISGHARKATNEQPVFRCEFTNECGGVLRFLNTSRQGECFWVESMATNYKKLDVSVEEHLRSIADAKRVILQKELSSKLEEVQTINSKILELNKEFPQAKALDEQSNN